MPVGNLGLLARAKIRLEGRAVEKPLSEAADAVGRLNEEEKMEPANPTRSRSGERVAVPQAEASTGNVLALNNTGGVASAGKYGVPRGVDRRSSARFE